MLPDERTVDEADAMLPAERRLADSRAELESILIPEPGSFPRSHTMRFMLGGGGKALASGAVAGLMAAKPGLAAGLLRILPIGRLLRRML